MSSTSSTSESNKQNTQDPTTASHSQAASSVLETSAPENPKLPNKRLSSLDTPSSSLRGRGGRVLSQPKFFGRRSAAARSELEKAEAEKRKVDSEAKRGPRAQDAASRRGRGRGRGGYMGEGERKPRDGLASGPFAAGQADKDERAKKKSTVGGSSSGGQGGSGAFSAGYQQPGGRSGTLKSDSSGRIKQDPDATDWRNRATDSYSAMDIRPIVRKTEDGGYISSDEEEADRDEGKVRVNVEDFSNADVTADDGTESAPFAPIRITRVAHKERIVGVNADGATNKDGVISVDANDTVSTSPSNRRQVKQKGKNVEVPGQSQPFMAVYDDSSSDAEHKPEIKSEPEASEQNQEPPSSPERNRRAKDKLKARVAPDMPDFQTQEEMDEWKRHQRAMEMMRSELGTPANPGSAEEDDTMLEGETPVGDKRQNKVYLFQFPPVLPDLLPPGMKPYSESSTANNAQQDSTGDPMETDGPSNTAPKPVSINDERLRQPVLHPGYIGKMRVHASGRTTLDWGGTSFEVGMGIESSCLQEIMLAKMPNLEIDKETGKQQYEDKMGMVISMGQVKGKFVVTPNWDEILS